MKTNQEYSETHFTRLWVVLVLATIAALCFLAAGCTGQQYQLHGGTTNGAVVGGVSVTDTNSGLTAGLNGNYDPATGEYGGEIVITFSREPDSYTAAILTQNGAELDRAVVTPAANVVYKIAVPKQKILGKDKVNTAIQTALQAGAIIKRR